VPSRAGDVGFFLHEASTTNVGLVGSRVSGDLRSSLRFLAYYLVGEGIARGDRSAPAGLALVAALSVKSVQLATNPGWRIVKERSSISPSCWRCSFRRRRSARQKLPNRSTFRCLVRARASILPTCRQGRKILTTRMGPHQRDHRRAARQRGLNVKTLCIRQRALFLRLPAVHRKRDVKASKSACSSIFNQYRSV